MKTLYQVYDILLDPVWFKVGDEFFAFNRNDIEINSGPVYREADEEKILKLISERRYVTQSKLHPIDARLKGM